MILRNHVALIVVIDVASAFAAFSNYARVTLLGAFRAMNRPLFTRARARLTAAATATVSLRPIPVRVLTLTRKKLSEDTTYK